jgi:putative transposase
VCAPSQLPPPSFTSQLRQVHFVAVPKRPDSIWRTFHRVHSIYGAIFNAKYGLFGRLWEGRPRSTPTDEGHFLTAVRYVERNPVRAGMIQRAEEYPWSSARFHCGLVATDVLVDPAWPGAEPFGRWSEWLSGESEPATENILRRNTLSGQPCGDAAFISRLEKQSGQTIRPRKPGRKGAHT